MHACHALRVCKCVSWPLLHDVQHTSFSSHCICMSWQLLQVRHDLYIRVLRSVASAIECILVSLYVLCHLPHVRYDLYIRVVGTIRRGRGVIVGYDAFPSHCIVYAFSSHCVCLLIPFYMPSHLIVYACHGSIRRGAWLNHWHDSIIGMTQSLAWLNHWRRGTRLIHLLIRMYTGDIGSTLIGKELIHVRRGKGRQVPKKPQAHEPKDAFGTHAFFCRVDSFTCVPWISHGTHVNASCPTSHMNESWHTCILLLIHLCVMTHS